VSQVFLPGETIDLCVPQEADFDIWSGWFNSQSVTTFLEQGKYPQTRDQQVEFYKNEVSAGRFLCMIKAKDGALLGVISLSTINFEKSSAQIALVCPGTSRRAPLAGLEAMALATQHAFSRFGLNRIWAGQAYPGLKKWTQRLSLIGYSAEGFARDGFVHGLIVTDSVQISILRRDYLRISARRAGTLWPGEQRMRLLISELQKRPSQVERLSAEMAAFREQEMATVEAIEADYA
jgi:hypothetical protein